MRGRLVLLNSIAHSLIRLNPLQNLSLTCFELETEYKSTRANLNFDGSYQYSTPRAALKPYTDIRLITVTVPVMRYYFGSQGQLLTDYERSTNFAWLEWMYNIHKTVKTFLFDHPIYGTLKVRFAEPLKVPKGIKGGQAALEGVQFTLAEVYNTALDSPLRLGPAFLLNLDQNYWDTHTDFDYPYHLVSTEYNSEDTVVQLGGNYQYTVRGAKPEERIFTLYFDGLRYSQTGDIIIADTSDDNQLSMQHLENFYQWYGLDDSFYYPHPTYGRVKVRFKEPLKIPKLRENANGWTESFTVTLVEVIEDATRYV